MPNDIVQTLTDHYLPLIRQLGYHTHPTGNSTEDTTQHTICNTDHTKDWHHTSYGPIHQEPKHRCECPRALAITINPTTLQLHRRHKDHITIRPRWHEITTQDLNHPTAIEDYTHTLHKTLWPPSPHRPTHHPHQSQRVSPTGNTHAGLVDPF